MPQMPGRPVGRPPIDDSFLLYLFVETGRRQKKQSIAAFTRDFERTQPRRPADGRRWMSAETLRRRYSKAKHDLGLLEPKHPHVEEIEHINAAREVMEPLVQSFIDSDYFSK